MLLLKCSVMGVRTAVPEAKAEQQQQQQQQHVPSRV
jgi:hypothetical protein